MLCSAEMQIEDFQCSQNEAEINSWRTQKQTSKNLEKNFAIYVVSYSTKHIWARDTNNSGPYRWHIITELHQQPSDSCGFQVCFALTLRSHCSGKQSWFTAVVGGIQLKIKDCPISICSLHTCSSGVMLTFLDGSRDKWKQTTQSSPHISVFWHTNLKLITVCVITNERFN